MRRHLLVTLAVVLALGFTASVVSAQCAIEHPQKAKNFKVSLVQAFVSCGNPGGLAANTATEGGVTACTPVTTLNQYNGGEPNGWRFDPLKSQGQVQMKPKKKPACKQKDTSYPPACAGGLNPADTVDLEAQLKLKGVIATDSPLGASGSGTLATVARATLTDRVGGPMTVVDFPAGFPFTLTNGKTSLKTSADALLNAIGQPGLPPCSSLEIVTMTVLDENGNPFANMGAFLPLP
jgi:hypothetical protein